MDEVPILCFILRSSGSKLVFNSFLKVGARPGNQTAVLVTEVTIHFLNRDYR